MFAKNQQLAIKFAHQAGRVNVWLVVGEIFSAIAQTVDSIRAHGLSVMILVAALAALCGAGVAEAVAPQNLLCWAPIALSIPLVVVWAGAHSSIFGAKSIAGITEAIASTLKTVRRVLVVSCEDVCFAELFPTCEKITFIRQHGGARHYLLQVAHHLASRLLPIPKPLLTY